MLMVRDTCLAYADGFGDSSTNLLFQGGTGLGKTFLSACVARTVAGRGFSVAYESCATALSAFETSKFSRDPAEAEAAAARVKQYLTCDLMILDDLGTEMVTSFSVSALYQIINGRLIAGKKTIVSTNLSTAELSGKYGPQIMSRLEGEYDFVIFKGQDIRQLKKERA
jgi:DNA replication protein DnaC